MANTYTTVQNTGKKVNEVLEHQDFSKEGRFYKLERLALRKDGSVMVDETFKPKQPYHIVYKKYVDDKITQKIEQHNLDNTSHIDIRNKLDNEIKERQDADEVLSEYIGRVREECFLENKAIIDKINIDEDGYITYDGERLKVDWNKIFGTSKPNIFKSVGNNTTAAGYNISTTKDFSSIFGVNGTANVNAIFSVAAGTTSQPLISFEVVDGENPANNFYLPLYYLGELSESDNSKQLATTEFVNKKVERVGGAGNIQAQKYTELPPASIIGQNANVVEDEIVEIPNGEDSFLQIFKPKGDYITTVNNDIYEWVFKPNNINNKSIVLLSLEWAFNSISEKYEQTIECMGVTEDNNISIVPPYESIQSFIDNKIYAESQYVNSLKFIADTLPTTDISVGITIMG